MTKKLQSLSSICILSFTIIIGFFACDSQEDAVDTEVAYYRQSQLRNIYRNGILPDLLSFSEQVSRFSELAEATLSDELVVADELSALQKEWINLSSAWAGCELYNLGQISDEFLHTRIYWWPIAHDKIEVSILQAGSTWDINSAAQLGADQVGIASLEYLLFNDENEVMLDQFNHNTVRSQFLLSVIQNLETETTRLMETWNSYQNEFETQLEGDLKGSQNKVLNAFINHLEVIVIDKLGKPLQTQEDDHLPQAVLSQQSLALLNENLMTIKKLYTGDFSKSPFPVGFDDFLFRVGSDDTAATILTQINTCTFAINNIGPNLASAIAQQPSEVIQLQNEFIELLILIKVDLGNQLGATITISPTDGD